MNSEWYRQLEENVLEQKENIHKKDFTFYLIDRFLLMSKRIDLYSENCKECESLKKRSMDLSTKLSDMINGGISSKREMEREMESIFNHLKKDHGIRPQKYFTSFFSLIGMLAGTILGGVLAFPMGWNIPALLLVGWAVGLGVGRIYGNSRDNSLKKQEKLL